MELSELLKNIKSEYDAMIAKMKELETKGDKSSLEYKNVMQSIITLREIYSKLKDAKSEDDIRNVLTELTETRKELKTTYNEAMKDQKNNADQIYLVAMKHNLMRKYIIAIREIADKKVETKTSEIKKKEKNVGVADKKPVAKVTKKLTDKKDLIKEFSDTFDKLREEDNAILSMLSSNPDDIRLAYSHEEISRELTIIKSIYLALKSANSKEEYVKIVDDLTTARKLLDEKIISIDSKEDTDLEAVSAINILASQKSLIRKYLDKVMGLYSLTPSAKHYTVVDKGVEMDYIPRNKKVIVGGKSLPVDPDMAEDIFEYNFSCVSIMLDCSKELLPLLERSRTMSKTDDIRAYDEIEHNIKLCRAERREMMPKLFSNYPNCLTYKHGRQIEFMNLLDNIERLEDMYTASIIPVHYEPYKISSKEVAPKFIDLTRRISDLYAKGESSELFKKRYTPEEIASGATPSKYIEELLHRRFDLYYSVVTLKQGETRTFDLFYDERSFNYNSSYEEWIEYAKKNEITDLSPENFEDDLRLDDSIEVLFLEKAAKDSEIKEFMIKPIHSRSSKEELRKQLVEAYTKLCNLGGLAAIESFGEKIETQTLLFNSPFKYNYEDNKGVLR